MQLATIKLTDIKKYSQYLRQDTDVDTLKKSIDKVGLINPLTVNEDYELLAGARRFQAVMALGWTEVDVHIVQRDALQQELISIDENLVRQALSRLELEQCLNRGREIYEQLNPSATKVDLSADDSSSPTPVTADATSEQAASSMPSDDNDSDSFAVITAEKTGLSESVIKSAIKRDALAADSVKQARSQGELNATQTNQIIQLDKTTQAQVLPLIADKTVQEARRIIQVAKTEGVAAAVTASEKIVPMPKEYTSLKSPLKRVNKNLSKILLEGMVYTGPEKDQINKELTELKDKLVTYFAMIEQRRDEADHD